MTSTPRTNTLLNALRQMQHKQIYKKYDIHATHTPYHDMHDHDTHITYHGPNATHPRYPNATHPRYPGPNATRTNTISFPRAAPPSDLTSRLYGIKQQYNYRLPNTHVNRHRESTIVIDNVTAGRQTIERYSAFDSSIPPDTPDLINIDFGSSTHGIYPRLYWFIRQLREDRSGTESGRVQAFNATETNCILQNLQNIQDTQVVKKKLETFNRAYAVVKLSEMSVKSPNLMRGGYDVKCKGQKAINSPQKTTPRRRNAVRRITISSAPKRRVLKYASV